MATADDLARVQHLDPGRLSTLNIARKAGQHADNGQDSAVIHQVLDLLFVIRKRGDVEISRRGKI